MSKEYKCCNNPDYVTAFVPRNPFKARYCLKCEEIILDCNPFWTFIWKWIYYPFWNGDVFIEHQLEEEVKHAKE